MCTRMIVECCYVGNHVYFKLSHDRASMQHCNGITSKPLHPTSAERESQLYGLYYMSVILGFALLE
eukprot:SAG31_NODE_1145_length_9684_cov_12.800209_8_plen_66_part_00